MTKKKNINRASILASGLKYYHSTIRGLVRERGRGEVCEYLKYFISTDLVGPGVIFNRQTNRENIPVYARYYNKFFFFIAYNRIILNYSYPVRIGREPEKL